MMAGVAAATRDPDRPDLLVVGGGINGLAIARDAARRGLSVLLADKTDIGGATSQTSSRMIHGGLRYLESFDFAAGVLCVGALLALFRFRFGVLTLVLAAAASGIALQLVGLV